MCSSEHRAIGVRLLAPCVALLCIAAWPGQTPAQSAEAPRLILAVGAQADSESATRVVGAVDWAVGETTWLQATASWTDAPLARGDVTTRALDLGIEQRFGTFGVILTGGYWGDPDSVQTWRYGGSLYYAAQGWRIGAGLARRDIDVIFRLPTMTGDTLERTAELHDDEFSLALRYSGELWSGYLSATEFDYSRDLAAIGDLPLLRLRLLSDLSASSLTLANSFLDYRVTLGVDRRLGLHALNLEYGRDETLIEAVRADTFSFGWLAPLGSRGDLELRFGFSDADELGNSLFAGVLLIFYTG